MRGTGHGQNDRKGAHCTLNPGSLHGAGNQNPAKRAEYPRNEGDEPIERNPWRRITPGTPEDRNAFILLKKGVNPESSEQAIAMIMGLGPRTQTAHRTTAKIVVL